jgi:hypothetical protein
MKIAPEPPETHFGPRSNFFKLWQARLMMAPFAELEIARRGLAI